MPWPDFGAAMRPIGGARLAPGLTRAAAAIGALAVPAIASAQAIVLKPLAEVRVREEHVAQDGIARDADAVTIRARAGIEAHRARWSALVETEGTLAVVDHYFDGLHGAPTRPLVADPEDIALYRAQIQYRDKDVAITFGRQRISIDDDRFVDAGLFRDNAQSFDAVRVQYAGVPRLTLDATYAWSVRTVWGIEGTGARPTAAPGPNVFAELGYATPLGTVTAFGYLVGQDDPALQGYRLASQTAGVRIAGQRTFSPRVKLAYKASYARQRDWLNNPNRYDAGFYLLDAALGIDRATIGAGYEVDGASHGAAFTSFQFPVGSGFRYRGWAGKLYPTPPDGTRDLYASLGYALPRAGPLTALAAQGAFHHFESDRAVRHYGDEVDFLVSARWQRYTGSVRLAHYIADRFATDTDKLWLQLDWVY